MKGKNTYNLQQNLFPQKHMTILSFSDIVYARWMFMYGNISEEYFRA